ncbi:glutamate receptor ionotropic, NMDA 1-like [Montipora foliosa]|uniref:glutamate receptor ionotropic, NMDA 1-like n=1 Tax=Montipora foliosa TaxID=591990 RepID=UPI0035F189C0
MALREAFIWSLTVFDVIVLLIFHGGAVDNYHVRINIPVFFNTDGIYEEFVFNSAMKLFASRGESQDRNKAFNDLELKMEFSRVDFVNLSARSKGLSSLIPIVANMTSSIQGAVFVDVTRKSLAYSALLEGVSVPSVGLFRSENGFPITQESSIASGLARVAAPSVIDYAHAVAKIMHKMGWQTFCLLVSTTYDGKIFADTMNYLAFKEKWIVASTVWSNGVENLTETRRDIQNVIEKKIDVVVTHLRLTTNDKIFQIIQDLQSVQNSSAWLVSDVSIYGVRNLSTVPSGVTMIGTRSPEVVHDSELYINVLYDSFVLFESAYKRSFKDLGKEDSIGNLSSSQWNGLQQRAMRYLKEIHITGRSSLFKKQSLADQSQHGLTFYIWDLKVDLNKKKHWVQVGLITASGLALEPLQGLSGNKMFPLLSPRRPTLRVSVVLSPPYVSAQDPSSESHEPCAGRAVPCYEYIFTNSTKKTKKLWCCFGASIDFMKFLQRDLGFNTNIYLAPDGQHGKFNQSKGTWSGIVNEIICGRADLGLDLAVNMKRSQVVEMINPTVSSSLNILVKKEYSQPKEAKKWFSWLKPFEWDLWIAILVTCNVVLVAVWWLDRKSPKGYYHILKDSDEDAFTLLDSMSYVWGVAFSKDIGAEKTPRSNGARLVSAVYAFLALVIVNTYCANLMAFLVQESSILPITGIHDEKLTKKSLYPPAGFKIGITKGSNEEAYFKNHVEDEFRKIYDVNLKVHLVDSLEDGIEQLKANELHGVIGDSLSLQQAGNKDAKCRFSLAGSNFYTHGYGFAFTKGSRWVQEATLSVLKNQENGSIDAIMNYWFPKKVCKTVPVEKLDYGQFVGLFLLIVGVMAFSFLALLSEIVIIFMLIKFGKHLGPLGKFLKRMIFSVRKGEENDIKIKLMQFSKQSKSMQPNRQQTCSTSDVSFRSRASFYNLSFELSADLFDADICSEQMLNLRRFHVSETVDYTSENGENCGPKDFSTELKDSDTQVKQLGVTTAEQSEVSG